MANDYVTNTAQYHLPLVVTAALQGLQCFDCDYYRQASQDLPAEFTCNQMFEHYINNGQFEGRAYRCDIAHFAFALQEFSMHATTDLGDWA